MAIWTQRPTPQQLNERCPGTLAEALGIVFLDVSDDSISATMPVDHRTMQPYGLLHGGASVALAETLGSIASACCVDTAKRLCVGLEINANHLRAARRGHVTGTARPLHLGQTTHVWQVEVRDDQQQLVCISRLTVALLDRIE